MEQDGGPPTKGGMEALRRGEDGAAPAKNSRAPPFSREKGRQMKLSLLPIRAPSPPSSTRMLPQKWPVGRQTKAPWEEGRDGGSPPPCKGNFFAPGKEGEAFSLSLPAPPQATCFPRVRGGQTVYGAGWGPSGGEGQADKAAPPPHQSPAGGLLLCAASPAQSIAPAGGEQAFPTFFPPAVCVDITPAKWGRLTPSEWQRRAFSPQSDIFYRACLRRIRTTKASISSPLVG